MRVRPRATALFSTMPPNTSIPGTTFITSAARLAVSLMWFLSTRPRMPRALASWATSMSSMLRPNTSGCEWTCMSITPAAGLSLGGGGGNAACARAWSNGSSENAATDIANTVVLCFLPCRVKACRVTRHAQQDAASHQPWQISNCHQARKHAFVGHPRDEINSCTNSIAAPLRALGACETVRGSRRGCCSSESWVVTSDELLERNPCASLLVMWRHARNDQVCEHAHHHKLQRDMHRKTNHGASLATESTRSCASIKPATLNGVPRTGRASS